MTASRRPLATGRLTGATMSTGRAEAFSDGVFAIAITLLVLSLRLSGNGTVTSQLLAAWPQYFAYVVSFLTIGIMWMNHHTILAHVQRVNRPLLVINLLLLMGIVAIPFPTVLVAQHLTDAGGTAAVVTYGLVMIAISCGFAGLVDLRGDPCPGPRRGLASRGAAQVHPRVHRRPDRLRAGHPGRGRGAGRAG